MNQITHPPLLCSMLLLVLCTPALAERELSADRPDVTESAYTVEPGRLQIEMSFFELSRDRQAGVEVRELKWLPVNFKVGVWQQLDLQLLFTPYAEQEQIDAAGNRNRQHGFGDETLLRAKINLWGNHSGAHAMAIMPFIKLPTGTNGLSNHHVEGGMSLPFAMELSPWLGLAAMVQMELLYDELPDDYVIDQTHTVTFGLTPELFGPMGWFVEYVGVVSELSDAYLASFNSGLTFAVNDNLQLDVAAQWGLNGVSDDLGLLSGLTARY